MKVCYIFPNNCSARFSAVQLLKMGTDVVFYCLDRSDLDMVQNIVFELNLIARKQNRLRNQSDSFECRTDGDLMDVDIIGKNKYMA